MMELTNKKVNSCLAFRFHWMLWRALGFQPPERTSKWFKAYIAYTIILNLTVLFFPTCFVINLFLSKNMTELCENICNTTTELACILKIFNFIVAKHKLIKVHKILKQLDARTQTHKEVAILEEGIASARKLFLVFTFFCLVLGITSQVPAFVSNEKILIHPMWVPWNWTTSESGYLLTQLYIIYVTIVQTQQNAVNDTYPAAYLIILSSQIRALASRIKDLGTKDTSSENILYGKLKDCIKDHNTIQRLFLTIEDSISTTCLIQFAATCISQCTMGVYVLYGTTNRMKLIHTCLFFLAITTEIFILCYYGDLYCQANDHLTESIYACSWMDRDKRFKKVVLFLLQRSQMPNTITAGVLIPVRLPTFVKIIKSAYSVFTVLNNFNTN